MRSGFLFLVSVVRRTSITAVLVSCGWSLGGFSHAIANPLDTAGKGGSTASYVLGPEDEISIRVLDAEDISDKPIRIESDGYINLPTIGRIKAGGSSTDQLRESIAAKLKPFIREPQVSVSIVEFHSHPVSVFGAVNTPGIQQIRGQLTLIELISMAGGLRPDAGTVIRLTRPVESGSISLPSAKPDATGKFSVAEIRIKPLMDGASPQENIPVLAGDVISVPRAQMLYVLGEVGKAGGFVLSEKDSMSAIQALALAQGLTRTAAPQHARILHGNTDTPVRLDQILAGKTKDIPLGPDDTLYVPSSIPKRAAIRALEAMIQTGSGLAIFR